MKPGILCVDDEAILTLALTRSLKSAFGPSVHVDAACSAEEALEAIEELKGAEVDTQVVICDLFMPGIRGDEFLATIKVRYPNIRSILLTGMPDEEESAKIAGDLGLFALLSKPVKTSELVEIVGKALGKS